MELRISLEFIIGNKFIDFLKELEEDGYDMEERLGRLEDILDNYTFSEILEDAKYTGLKVTAINEEEKGE